MAQAHDGTDGDTLDPGQHGFDPQRLELARAVMERHVAERTTPGAVGLVVCGEGVVARWAVGGHTYDAVARKVQPDDIYDLASLTKIVATTTVCMVLCSQGKLDLDEKVVGRVPAFQGNGREAVTVRDLLAHCSGLPAYKRLYETCRSREEAVEAICGTSLTYATGSDSIYSDLGFILLGRIAELASGDPLDRLAKQLVFVPVGVKEATYRPGAELLARIPPTEQNEGWRHRLIHGEVHDENAAAMGGVAPHAGVFAPADDLGRFLRAWLGGGVLDGQRVFDRDWVRRFTSRADIVPESTRALGWDTVSPTGSMAGRHFSSQAFGHSGFTGTTLWADPDRDLGVVLLTNRVHPTRENEGIRRMRPEFHDAVAEALI